MRRKIKVGVSNRHVHLTEEVCTRLFISPLSKRNDLSQIGDYAANETVTLKTDKGSISNVRVIGPCRSYNQVEISRSDARKLGINPPVRKSGDLLGSESITIVGDKGEVILKESCIIAERHVHMNFKEADMLGVRDGEMVKILVNGDKSGMMDAYVKVSKNGIFSFHIDTDDANAFGLNNEDAVEIAL